MATIKEVNIWEVKRDDGKIHGKLVQAVYASGQTREWGMGEFAPDTVKQFASTAKHADKTEKPGKKEGWTKAFCHYYN